MSTENQALQLGALGLQFRPHHISGIGARVFVIIDEPRMHEALNLSADDARLFADRLKIAACQAEAIGRKTERRGQQNSQVDS